MTGKSESRVCSYSYENYYSFDEIRSEPILCESQRHLFELTVTVSDDFRDVDPARIEKFQRSAIDAGPAIGIKPAGSSCRGDERRLDELDIVEHAQVDAMMPVPVKEHRRLFAQQARHLFKQLADACRFDQVIYLFAVRQVSHGFDQVSRCGIDH